jgi:hypothetical protein
MPSSTERNLGTVRGEVLDGVRELRPHVNLKTVVPDLERGKPAVLAKNSVLANVEPEADRRGRAW